MQSSVQSTTARQRATLLVGIGALLVVLGAQYYIRLDASDAPATTALIAAAVIAAIALAGADTPQGASVDLPERVPDRAARVLVPLGYAGVVAGSVLLSVRWQRSFLLGLLVFLLSVTVLSVGLARRETRPAGALQPWTPAEVAALLGILAVALVLRFYRFTEFPDPYGIFAVEEPQTGMGGFLILEGRRPWEFLLDHYLAALALRVGGPTLPALRVPFAFFSALTVVPLYWLLRQFVRKSAALFGTFLLAASSWHLVSARCAHNIFLTTFFVVLLLALLVSAERTHRLWYYPWIGLVGGYTLYAYAGYRGSILFVVLFVGLAAARHARARQRAGTIAAQSRAGRLLARDLEGLGVAAFVIVTMIPPIIVQVSRDPRHISYFEAAGRATGDTTYYTSDVGDFITQRLARAREAVGVFLHTGDLSPTFNLPGTPMLDPVTGMWFVAGIMYALCFPWRGYNAFFLIMFAVLFVGGTIFVHNLDVRRMHGLIPLVVVFAALSADRVFESATRVGAAAVGAVYALTLVAAFAVLGWSYNFFFHRMAQSAEVRAGFHNEYTQLIRLAMQDARGHYVVLVSDIPNFFTPSDYFWLISNRIDGQRLVDLAAILLPHHLPIGEVATVVVEPPFDGGAIATLLRAEYPGVVCREDVGPQIPRLALTVCDIPAGAMPRDTNGVGTLRARYYLRRPLHDERPVLERNEPFISYAFVPTVCRRRVLLPNAGKCYADWIGTFDLADDATVSVLPRTKGGKVKVRIDGVPAGVEMHLARGTHELHAIARFPREDDTGVQISWELPGQAATLMPFYRRSSANSP